MTTTSTMMYDRTNTTVNTRMSEPITLVTRHQHQHAGQNDTALCSTNYTATYIIPHVSPVVQSECSISTVHFLGFGQRSQEYYNKKQCGSVRIRQRGQTKTETKTRMKMFRRLQQKQINKITQKLQRMYNVPRSKINMVETASGPNGTKLQTVHRLVANGIKQ